MEYSHAVDKVYYNMVIAYQAKDNEANCKASTVYNEDDVILAKASDWYLSVIRFDIPTRSIPILFVDINESQPNPNQTQYSVSLEYNGGFSPQTFLEFTTSHPNYTVPTIQSNGKYPRGIYYGVYTYNRMIEFLNTALATAFAALPGAPATTPPFVSFNSATNIFSLNCDVNFYASNIASPPGPIKIYFNNKLYSFFEGFDVNYLSRIDPNGRDILFNIIPNGNVDSLGMIKESQDYPTISSWNSFRSLQLRSNMLQTNMEYVPSGFDSSSKSSSNPIIADFIPLFGESAGSSLTRTTISYSLNSAYKLINLMSDAPLTKFSLQIYWLDELGQETELTLNYRETVSVKILFHRKSSYRG